MSLAKSILHPTDFSDASQDAFLYALALAVGVKGALTILHAGVDEPVEDALDHFPAVRRTLERWGYLQASSPQSAVFDTLDVQIKKIRLRQRSPIVAVHEYLDEFHTDLIVLGTEGRDGLPAWLKPSMAERIARDTTSMTLFVQQGVRGFIDPESGGISLARILVPVANTPAAQPALSCATKLARLAKAPVEIVVFHVGEDPMPIIGKLLDPQFVFREERGRGHIVAEIDRAVREFDADVVVMTTDGRDGFLGAMGQGSHTERVVRQAACPVLAVPVSEGLPAQ